ncbi:MAG: hypothetical protein G01um101430_206 [Parcubacteria group bacterium Gr01-1014_30]|nr:MAG: hypothetical protein G01um101430_206 [Parcubacteria group bacterium Gr01-1014_30]
MNDKNAWESFFENKEDKSFLQSWAWGEVQKKLGNKVWRLGLLNSGGLSSAILAVKIQAKRGNFLLVPHGISMSGVLLNILKEIASRENCSFIRVAPLLPRNEENIKLFKDSGFIESSMHASAYEATWKLDIAPSEEELIRNMRKTTRYLIRQAEKNADIEVVMSDKISDLELYNQLAKETAKKQHFVPFSEEVVKAEFEVFAKDNKALLLFAKYRSEAEAAVLIIFWSNIGFYHQAALSDKHHKVPLAYLLQWEAIKEAKKRGCRIYDFWGYIDPKKYPKHPWAGPTLFKLGFNGKAYEYMKTQDLPLSKKYWLTYTFEKLRKLKRGL